MTELNLKLFTLKIIKIQLNGVALLCASTSQSFYFCKATRRASKSEFCDCVGANEIIMKAVSVST